MSRSHRRSAGLTFALSALIAGGARAEPTAEQILLGADAVLAPEDFEADLSMVTHRTDGAPRAFEMHDGVAVVPDPPDGGLIVRPAGNGQRNESTHGLRVVV
jgi:hypothetical protein